MRSKIAALVAAVAAAAGTAGAAVWARGRKEGEELDVEVSEPRKTRTDPRPAAAVEAAAPSVAAAPAEAGSLDDLTAIKGLGKVKAGKLVEAGVTSYAQIAAWTDDDIPGFGLTTNTSPGQIKREDWVGQAKALAEG